VYDIGAAEGDSALLLARLAAPGTVVAFEPEPAQRERLPQPRANGRSVSATITAR
jgi:FkbM family methyltransferase